MSRGACGGGGTTCLKAKNQRWGHLRRCPGVRRDWISEDAEQGQGGLSLCILMGSGEPGRDTSCGCAET